MHHSSETIEALFVRVEGTPAPANSTPRQLLDPDWCGDLYAAVTKPDNSLLMILELSGPTSIETDDLAESDALRVSVQGHTGVERVEIQLADDAYRDTFFVLVADLANRVASTDSEDAGARMLVRHLGRWLHFLKHKKVQVLSRSKLIGLYGELTILNDVVASVVGIENAVQSWTGPSGSFQDFQLPGLAIEVKALSSTKPQRLEIASERQLDDRGLGALLLSHLSVEVRQGSGLTLPEFIEAIDERLDPHPAAAEAFDELLFQVGYHRAHAPMYQSLGFTERTIHHYHVSSGFPRILEADLPLGVGSTKYSIDATACAPFEIDEARLTAWLTDPPSPTGGGIIDDESDLVEHKQTAWKPMKHESTPPEVMNFEIVKTVAAFQNAWGGTLVIGVKDRTMEVTGIEEDLEFLGVDRDTYELKLIGMIKKNLGESSLARLRTRFEKQAGKTVCVISIRAASSPVFGRDPSKPATGAHFWVREGNSSPSKTGDAMANYILEHFR